MSITLSRYSVIIIRNRHVSVNFLVGKSMKHLRVYTTEKTLPEKTFHAYGNSSNMGIWLKHHYNRFIGTYEDLSGMREVRNAQEEVVKIQEKLKDAQEQRRVLLQSLLDMRKNLQMLNNDIHAMDKGNPHYLELVKRQIELMQKERVVDNQFQFMDTNERDLFTHLTSAVRASHEKERSKSENSKYFLMVLSMISALLGILATAFTNHYRNLQNKSIRQQDLQKQVDRIIKSHKDVQKLEKRESWSEYISRHSSNFYRYFVPKR